MRDVEWRKRWPEYFEQVLKVKDVREANMINVFDDRHIPLFEELNEREISLEEVMETVKELKSDKTLSLYSSRVEYLKEF